MTDQLICVRDSFPADYLVFYAQHGVKTPVKDKLYNLRSFSRNSQGQMEVLLEEIINPEVPIKHPVLGISYKEPAWDSKRFSTLLGEILTLEMLREFVKENKQEKVLIKTKENEESLYHL